MIEKIAAPQVDVIGFSFGAVAVRIYLSGKQSEPGVFRPLADHK